jgi:hypothetical protein
MRRSRWLPALGLLASVALVWSVTVGLLWQTDSAAALLDEKYSSAERLIFYRVSPGGTLRLQVPAGAEAVRVVSHLVLPDAGPWSPDRQHQYGLGVRLVSEEGALLAEGPLFTRTRQSKAEKWGDSWLREAAFSATAGTQLGDEREFILRLPPEHQGERAALELRYPGTEGAVLLRVYAKFDRQTSALALRQATRLRQATARAERATFLWWDKLDEEARERLLDETWERLDPRGDPGRDFATEAVYRTDFRLPYSEVTDAARERLGAGRALALNVMGPARLDLWLWHDAAGTSSPPGPVALSTLSLDGVERRWEVPLPSGEPLRHPVEVAAGVHTLGIHNLGALDLRFTVEGPRWAQLGAREPPSVPGPAVTWLPDLRRAEGWASGPGCEALELELPPDADELTRLFRLDARLLAPSAAEGQAQPTLTAVLLNERGERVGEASFGAAPAEDPYEAALAPPRPRGGVPCAELVADAAGSAPDTVELDARPLPLSGPLSARIIAPPSARRLQLRSTRPVAIALYAFLPSPGGAVPEAPYSAYRSDATRWRNAPHQLGQWHLVRPGNHRALAEAGAALTLVSQVRLERAGPAEPREPTGESVSISPAGAPMSREVLEPDVAQGDDPRLSDPLRSLFTRLVPHQPVRVRFEGRTPARPELRLDLEDPSGLGADVRVKVDGAVVRRFRLRTSRTRELLPPVKPGVRELVVESDAPGLTAMLNRAPAPEQRAQALRLRNVYRVADALRVPVRKQAVGATTLNIVVYTREPDASADPRLRVTIDQGAPRRLTGVLVPRLTRADRFLGWPMSERPAATMTGAHKGRWYARTVSVTLGDDLAPGLHWVHVRPHGPPGEVWARFFIFDAQAEAEPHKRWSRPGWELEESP